ncbi:MAG: GntR family transcriptional regulator [Actinomycetaceae bacterium]|nr:GntR family transcriptional regulator [Actinomycetaceae bacterium]MDU0970507.1 GntR family transcriptional regulator [Actinomycetaceae bacterium]
MTEPVAPAITIDRTSPMPLYHQLSQPLHDMITSGELPAGTRLEDEVSMAKRLGVSRPTARRALQDLVDAGLVIRRRAVGTVVAPKAIHRNVALSSLYEDLDRDGQKPTTTVLGYEEVEANDEVADALNIAPGTPVIELRRLRMANGEPLALMTNYLPKDVAPEQSELETGGLYQAMRAHGHIIRTAKQTIGARKLTTAEAHELDEARGAAGLTMTRIGYTLDGDVIEYGTHVYRASHYSFTLTLSQN